jgi:hypothetical protein
MYNTLKVKNYKICFSNSVFVPNMSTSLQTTLAAEAHLAEGQFLLEEQTLNIKVSDISNRNPKTNSFQNRRAKFRPTVNLRKEECIKVTSPLMQSVQFQLF